MSNVSANLAENQLQDTTSVPPSKDKRSTASVDDLTTVTISLPSI